MISNKLDYEIFLFDMKFDHDDIDQGKITYMIENVLYRVNHELIQPIDDQIIQLDYHGVWPLLNKI